MIGGSDAHGVMPQAHLSESPVPFHWPFLAAFVLDGMAVDGKIRWEGEYSDGHSHPRHFLSSTFDL